MWLKQISFGYLWLFELFYNSRFSSGKVNDFPTHVKKTGNGELSVFGS